MNKYIKKNKVVDSLYTFRFKRHFNELNKLYSKLYGKESKYFKKLCDIMEDCYGKRDYELKRIDANRSSSSKWYSEKCINGMMMQTENFGGTIEGIRKHLDYIEKCNVNYLYLMPLLESPEEKSDRGYAVSDYNKISSKLGDMEDLQNLAADCRKKNISLCIDFVVNHTSDEHEWALNAKNLNSEYMDYYLFFDDDATPLKYERTMPEILPEKKSANFTWIPEIDKYVMTTFKSYEWDLNYKNPEVFNSMVCNLLNLANLGIDVFKMDTIPYVWKRIDTSCRNLIESHYILRMLRIISEIVCPGIILVCEAGADDNTALHYFGTKSKPECHMIYNTAIMCTLWNSVATADVRLLKKHMDCICGLPKNNIFINYLRSNDAISWDLDYTFLTSLGMHENTHKNFLNDFFIGKTHYSDSEGELYSFDYKFENSKICGTTASLCGIERNTYKHEKIKLNRAKDLDIMLHAFIFTLSGIPVIYSGDEIAVFNDYSYKDDPEKVNDSRNLHNIKFPWKDTLLCDDINSLQGEIFTRLKQLEDIRERENVFLASADVWTIDTEDKSVLGISRYKDGNSFTGIFNFSSEEKVAKIGKSLIPWTDIITGSKIVPNGVKLKPYGFYWMMNK